MLSTVFQIISDGLPINPAMISLIGLPTLFSSLL